MGAFQSNMQRNPTDVPAFNPYGNRQPTSSPVGKGGSVTTPATSGQPQMGVPNQYANTIQSGDNTTTQQSPMPQGKGGAVSGPTPHGKGM